MNENNIDYVDFASGAETIDSIVEKFNQALDSEAELVWVVRGGNKCIQTLDKLNWNKIIASGKRFYGLSDFTHFSTMAVFKGVKCYYGQGLTNIKEYFPLPSERQFIVDLLKTGVPVSESAQPLANSASTLDVSKEKIVGGHLLVFTLMQGQLHIDLRERFIFIEYHTEALGESLDDLGYYIDQLLYVLKNNMPKGFILGRTEMKNVDGSQVLIEDINKYCVEKLSGYNLPIFYFDHFKNTITFS
ncbi:MAG TPA: LD-carboxypeptidase [Candidatus Paceibacterota bacterium]|nr:LD-carboxypeptidase [Candidatus Paceibacterota bacterium]